MRRTPLKRTPMRRKPSRRDPMPEEFREAVLRRDNHTCRLAMHGWHTCYGRLHAHHIILRSQGGNDDTLDGLTTVCGRGHEWVHRNVAAARAYGFLVPRGVTAREAQGYLDYVARWFWHQQGRLDPAHWLTVEDVQEAIAFSDEWRPVLARLLAPPLGG